MAKVVQRLMLVEAVLDGGEVEGLEQCGLTVKSHKYDFLCFYVPVWYSYWVE